MKNLLRKTENDRFNDLFFNLAFGLFAGFFSGLMMFIMASNEKSILTLGIIIAAIGVYSVYTYEYKSAALVFATILPIMTLAAYLKMGIKYDTPELTTGLLVFLQGFFSSLVLSILIVIYRHGGKLIKDDKGYGGPPTPPFE